LHVGGDLSGHERRRVERHLITCADCRAEERSLARALGGLREVLAAEPATSASKFRSLWPALQRQIRESRHAPTPAPAVFGRRGFAVLGGALAAGLLLVAGTSIWVRTRLDDAHAREALAARPVSVAAPPVASTDRAAIDGFGFGFSPSRGRPPLTSVARVDAAPAPPEPSARGNARVDYDLDRGTPMGDSGEVKASY
jgi:hypothetical protein